MPRCVYQFNPLATSLLTYPNLTFTEMSAVFSQVNNSGLLGIRLEHFAMKATGDMLQAAK